MLGMLLPALSAAREKARVISCTSNLKRINLAAVLYASDNDDYLPDSMESIQQYLGDGPALKCPNDGNVESEDYVFLPLETKKLNGDGALHSGYSCSRSISPPSSAIQRLIRRSVCSGHSSILKKVSRKLK